MGTADRNRNQLNMLWTKGQKLQGKFIKTIKK